MTYKAEVRDVGGCGVGTAVKQCATLTAAIRFVAATSKESWAGPWRIFDADGELVLEEPQPQQEREAFQGEEPCR